MTTPIGMNPISYDFNGVEFSINRDQGHPVTVITKKDKSGHEEQLFVDIYQLSPSDKEAYIRVHLQFESAKYKELMKKTDECLKIVRESNEMVANLGQKSWPHETSYWGNITDACSKVINATSNFFFRIFRFLKKPFSRGGN